MGATADVVSLEVGDVVVEERNWNYGDVDDGPVVQDAGLSPARSKIIRLGAANIEKGGSLGPTSTSLLGPLRLHSESAFRLDIGQDAV